MSDIAESIVGAIYIDSHGSLPACEAFLARIGLIDYLRRVMEGNIALLHPKEELGQLANQDKVRYEVGREGEGKEQRLWCQVFVGGREIVRVGNGLNIMEVQTQGADEACQALRMNLREACDFNGRWKAGGEGNVTIELEKEDVSKMELACESEDENSLDNAREGEDGDRESDSDVYVTAVE